MDKDFVASGKVRCHPGRVTVAGFTERKVEEIRLAFVASLTLEVFFAKALKVDSLINKL